MDPVYYPTMTVNWEEQWELFAPNYKDGYAHVPLKGGGQLRLKAGPGFGDLSHPTTRLSLKLLEEVITPGMRVLDIGCGSGVLTLSAALLGAKKVYGVDIDKQAVAHAQRNKKANSLDNVLFSYHIPTRFSPDLVLMNMILSEQKQAWNPLLKSRWIITSGVLASQKESYLALTESWGWTLCSAHADSGWLAFLFKEKGRS